MSYWHHLIFNIVHLLTPTFKLHKVLLASKTDFPLSHKNTKRKCIK